MSLVNKLHSIQTAPSIRSIYHAQTPAAGRAIAEKTRRLAHGFHNFTNYRIRILLAADGSRPYRRRPTIRHEPC